MKTNLKTATVLAIALLLLGGLAMPIDAKEINEAEEIAVTIYNENLALIREVREFSLAGGQEWFELSNVSGMLRPNTVHLSLPEGVEFALLEQNFDYDLVNQAKLLEKFIGREIMLIDDENNNTYIGTLLSPAGPVLQDKTGRILLSVPGRVVLPEGAADELLLRPTLSWLLWSAAAGRHLGELSYLSGGLSWEADYVLLLNADDTLGDVEGWVTLSNKSGTTYNNAKLKLVAGDVNLVRPEPQAELMRYRDAASFSPVAKGFVEEEFFEYHLYDLQRPTTLRNNQQKQIGLLTANGVPMTKILKFDGIHGGDVQVLIEFTNEEEGGMGMPLPAGTVRVFKNDKSGAAQFVGEDRIDHTPRDEDVRVYIGNAFDIVGETTRMDYKDLKKGYESSYKLVVKNHKESDDVVVTVPVRVGGDWKMLDASHEYTMKDAFTAEFMLPVKADGEVELTFSFRVVWR